MTQHRPPGLRSSERHEPASGASYHELWRAAADARGFLGEFATRLSEHEAPIHAAALAFYLFLALFPFVIFVLALLSLLPIDGLRDWILEIVHRLLPGDAAGVVAANLATLLETPRRGLLSFGALFALWTGSAGFRALARALDRAHDGADRGPWWRARLRAIALTVALSGLVIATFVLATLGGMMIDLLIGSFGAAVAIPLAIARWVVTIALVMLVVAAVYYACPSIDRDWQWIRPGAVLFTIGFMLTSAAFSFYVSRFADFDRTYGSLGAVIVLLLWLYLLGFFLIAGGELNALLERRARSSSAGWQGEAPHRQPHATGRGYDHRSALQR